MSSRKRPAGGFVLAHVPSLGVFGVVLGDHPPAEETARRVENPLAGVVVVVLLGLALYSFLITDPVHPITGLATYGGFVGSILGLAAFDWATVEAGQRFEHALGRVIRGDVEATGLVVADGTVFGFGFPRVFWGLGVIAGKQSSSSDRSSAAGALLSAVSYGFVLFVPGVLVIRRRLRYLGGRRQNGQLFAALVFGFAVYTACPFVATGYAERLWYRVIPSAAALSFFVRPTRAS